MKETLSKLYEHQALDQTEAYNVLLQIAVNDFNESEVASLLSVYLMRYPTLEEMIGFREAMMHLCTKVDLQGADVIDIVGTGGDGKNTFNISTVSAFVVAGAGIKVAKHGNYSASSISGSSNLLEYLGYTFSSDCTLLRRQLESANICFLHAPLFHPAMKNLSAIRKKLGVRTFFNLLGPITNPASPAKQLLGVSHLELMRMYHYLLQETSLQYKIIHSTDGYDEISLTCPFKILSNRTEQLIDPDEIGFEQIHSHDLNAGNTIADAASIFLKILQGKGTYAQTQVTIVNSGVAIHCAYPDKSLYECFEMAKESLQSGKAYQSFKKIINN
ncbi:MAG TPA: anthranilate phosphoribosyltransferase [Flavipsychrobacter sp.]|nr:anthranilate phosphoribosyltransferase [Flavipsychrobacter sp.]